jgi:DNA-binding LacI/PurR family transcriptional regulator
MASFETRGDSPPLLVRYTNQMSSGPIPPQRLSLVSLTARSLRDSMQSGHWQGHLPGERELCARLQVSRHTIRAALAELKREGLLEVSDRQRRSINAAKLQRSSAPHSQVIAIITPRPLLAMTAASLVMVDELRDQLSRAGFSLEIHVSAACFTRRPESALEALTARAPAAAWLLFGSLQPVQRWFTRRRLPCLVLGSCMDDVELPSVDVDYRATCRHAGALLRRRGHRSIALIRTTGDYGGDLESEHGLREACDGAPAVTLHLLRHNGSAAHICSLLDKALRGPNPPTACLVARAAHVLTVMMHLMRQGRRLPKDMAVIARDDDPFLQHVVPMVTRYAVDHAQFAKAVSKAVRQLAETGSLPPKAIRLIPQMIAGETV